MNAALRLSLACCFLGFPLGFVGCGGSGAGSTPNPTFTRDIAPIVFENCAPCHHPGGPGPFNLLTFDDLHKRGAQVVMVTKSRFMPPWLPESGYGDFEGERSLTDEQIATIEAWVDGGKLEGDPADLPPAPTWVDGWQLGKPDLVVTMPETYTLSADGPDVFRNFVIPVSIPEKRWVRTLEFRPGNPKIVHHARLLVDETSSSRRADAEDTEPGFDGMDTVFSQGKDPEGTFVGWTPGRVPWAGREDLAWPLEPGTDLVLQLHMPPSGKPEPIQSSIGLHFADRPPTRSSFLITLESTDIDIAPGQNDYSVRHTFPLPVDVGVLGIYPHAHYLGKTIHCYATLPDGRKEWLVRIDDWDFNWQDEYRYRKPVRLPRGSTIAMEITYDNSAENVRNPNQPPVRIRYGPQSKDEMGAVFVMVLPDSDADGKRLRDAYTRHRIRADIAYLEKRIEEEPDFALAYHDLGVLRRITGKRPAALALFRRAVEMDPDSARAHYSLGHMLAQDGETAEAIVHFERAIDINPDYAEAHINVGAQHASAGRLTTALSHLRTANQLSPDDPVARKNIVSVLTDLGIAHARKKEFDVAIAYFEEALEIAPRSAPNHENLARVLTMAGRGVDAQRHQEKAAEIRSGE